MAFHDAESESEGLRYEEMMRKWMGTCRIFCNKFAPKEEGREDGRWMKEPASGKKGLRVIKESSCFVGFWEGAIGGVVICEMENVREMCYSNVGWLRTSWKKTGSRRRSGPSSYWTMGRSRTQCPWNV